MKYNTCNYSQVLLQLLHSMSLISEIFFNFIVPLLYIDTVCASKEACLGKISQSIMLYSDALLLQAYSNLGPQRISG